MGTLRGKTALVTGASSGLGEAAARALAAEGVAVMAVARRADRVREVAQEIVAAGGAAAAMGCDVARYGDVEAVAQAMLARFGRIDLLINNAGVIEPIAPVVTSDPAAWAQSIQINLTGAYHALRAVAPHMLAAGQGCIVNVSSGAAYRALEGWSAYCSGKAGLAMLTQSLHGETQGQGLRVYGFSPGTIDTDMQGVIRASGLNPISRIPRSELSPVAHAVKGLLALCADQGAELAGRDISMRDEAFRARIGLA